MGTRNIAILAKRHRAPVQLCASDVCAVLDVRDTSSLMFTHIGKLVPVPDVMLAPEC